MPKSDIKRKKDDNEEEILYTDDIDQNDTNHYDENVKLKDSLNIIPKDLKDLKDINESDLIKRLDFNNSNDSKNFTF